MTTGVAPDSIVPESGSTGRKLPAFFSSPKKSTPGAMSSAEPPLAIAAIITPLNAAPAWVGSPLSATLPLYSGLSRSASEVTSGHLGRVVADRHVAAVVVDPGAIGVLELGRDLVQGLDLVGREHVGVGQRDGLAEVEDVRRLSVPLRSLAALISSWLDPSGWSELMSMSYLSSKVEIISP